LDPKNNPRAENIISIVKVLQDEEDISLHVRAAKHKVVSIKKKPVQAPAFFASM